MEAAASYPHPSGQPLGGEPELASFLPFTLQGAPGLLSLAFILSTPPQASAVFFATEGASSPPSLLLERGGGGDGGFWGVRMWAEATSGSQAEGYNCLASSQLSAFLMSGHSLSWEF